MTERNEMDEAVRGFDGQVYLTIQQVAKRLHLSDTHVRRIFKDMPGVLNIPSLRRARGQNYTTIRIPESLLLAWIEDNTRARQVV